MIRHPMQLQLSGFDFFGSEQSALPGPGPILFPPRFNSSSLSSVSRARAEATAFAPSSPRCPQGRDCSSAASSCPFSWKKLRGTAKGKEIGGLPEGTGTGIWARGFQESRRVIPRLGSTSRESRPFGSRLG